jgi:hypothetical protein
VAMARLAATRRIIVDVTAVAVRVHLSPPGAS